MRTHTSKGFESHVEVCCHRVRFWYDTGRLKLADELVERLTEEAEQRSTYCITNGYSQGVLNCFYVTSRGTEHEISGWFNIE